MSATDIQFLRKYVEMLDREELISNVVSIYRYKYLYEKSQKELAEARKTISEYKGCCLQERDATPEDLRNYQQHLSDTIEETEDKYERKLKKAESQSSEFAQMIEKLPDDMEEYSWDTKQERWVHQDESSEEEEEEEEEESRYGPQRICAGRRVVD